MTEAYLHVSESLVKYKVIAYIVNMFSLIKLTWIFRSLFNLISVVDASSLGPIDVVQLGIWTVSHHVGFKKKKRKEKKKKDSLENLCSMVRASWLHNNSMNLWKCQASNSMSG